MYERYMTCRKLGAEVDRTANLDPDLNYNLRFRLRLRLDGDSRCTSLQSSLAKASTSPKTLRISSGDTRFHVRGDFAFSLFDPMMG